VAGNPTNTVLGAIAHFGTALVRVTTGPLLQFGRTLATVGASAGRGVVGAAGQAAVYTGRELATNNFLQRRVSWAAYHASTAGLDALQIGAARAFQTYGSGNAGQAFSRAVTTNVLQQLNDKLGINIGGISEQSAASQRTAAMTGEIARYGGKITPELRAAVQAWNLQGEKRAQAEQRTVQGDLEKQYSADTSSINEDSFNQASLQIINLLTEISNSLKINTGRGW
jgi:hypothetical protein